MYMTVDEARHHEFIAQVNDLITLRAEALLIHDILYALALDQDNLVLAYAAVYGVEQLSAFNCFIHSITSLCYFRESRYFCKYSADFARSAFHSFPVGIMVSVE